MAFDENKWYRENREKRSAQIQERTNSYRARNREISAAHRRNNPCVICGFSDWRALVFDHIDPSIKRDCVSILAQNACSPETLLAEILKCQILCANCHAIKTFEERDRDELTGLSGYQLGFELTDMPVSQDAARQIRRKEIFQELKADLLANKPLGPPPYVYSEDPQPVARSRT